MRRAFIEVLAFVLAGGLSACAAKDSPARDDGLRITVAPLELPGIGYACYDLALTNDVGQVVWSRGSSVAEGAAPSVCSNQYGNATGGDVTYVAPCDATDANTTDLGVALNRVTLFLDGLYGATGLDLGGYQNPCPWPTGCALAVECRENADVLVEFNLTVLRDAQQGFFDVAVDFNDIFCSAKLDTCYDETRHLELLHGADAVRDWTAVFGFACTAGAGDTHTMLNYGDLAIVCGATSFPIDPTAATGNNTVTAGPYVLHYGIYRGLEQLACDDPLTAAVESCHKVYWNLAFSLDDLALVGDGCTLAFSATATEGTGGFVDGLPTEAGGSYPYIDVNATLTPPVCQQHALNDGGAVQTSYHGNLDGQPPPPTMVSQYDGTIIGRSAARINTGAGGSGSIPPGPTVLDPTAVPMFDLAHELDLALTIPHWPWSLDGVWANWSAWAAGTFNSYTSLGMLPRTTLKYAPWDPEYQDVGGKFVTDELQWAIMSDPATGANAGALSPSFYPETHPFHTFRGHTLLWYGSPSLQKTGNNAWDENVLPLWLREEDARCYPTKQADCILDEPWWCDSYPAHCDGFPVGDPAASLREVTLRRQVFLGTSWLRDAMGPAARIQIDVANEMVKTIPIQGGTDSDYMRLPDESDSEYYQRVMFPYGANLWSGARVWSDIRPEDPLHFLELAFHVARDADPNAKLFLNDYDPYVDGVGAKSRAVREVARALKSRGAPLDGVGMQFHLQDQLSAAFSVNMTNWTEDPEPLLWNATGFAGWWDPRTMKVWNPTINGVWHPSFRQTLQDFMKSLAAFGVEAAVTELDYLTPDSAADDPLVQRRQARTYRDILDACLDSENCSTFVLWTAISPLVAPGSTGSGARGIFAADLSELPAYWSLLHGLWRGASPGSTMIEPEWVMDTTGATSSGGAPYRFGKWDGFAFWEIGELAYPVDLPAAGTYSFDVWAIGSPAAGADPKLAWRLDNTLYGTFDVGPSYTHLKPVWVLPAGKHVAKLSFTNDYSSPTEDRNVFIDAFALRPVHRVGGNGCHAIPVRDMGLKTSSFVDGSGWAIMFENATYGEALSVMTAGTYRLSLQAYGFGATRPANVEVLVDGVVKATWSLPPDRWGSAGATYEITAQLTRGTHALALRFTNDLFTGSEDLNVALNTLEVCPD